VRQKFHAHQKRACHKLEFRGFLLHCRQYRRQGDIAAISRRKIKMLNQKILDEISGKIGELMSKGPAKDVEKNVRAMLQALFSRLDLVTREEFDVQQEVLVRTREKLTQMEARVAEIEAAIERDKTAR
jgi:hypothetical protein